MKRADYLGSMFHHVEVAVEKRGLPAAKALPEMARLQLHCTFVGNSARLVKDTMTILNQLGGAQTLKTEFASNKDMLSVVGFAPAACSPGFTQVRGYNRGDRCVCMKLHLDENYIPPLVFITSVKKVVIRAHPVVDETKV